MARQSIPKPRKHPIGHAGGYMAEVDTAGMDPAMKETLDIRAKKGIKKKKAALDWLKGMIPGAKK